MTEGSPIIRRRSLLRVVAWSVGVVAALAVLAVIGLVALGAYLTSPPPYKPTPFDSAPWKAASGWEWREDVNVRRRMVQSLRASHVLEGKTRAEVEALLGPPEGADERYWEDSPVPAKVTASAREWHYVTGYTFLDYDFLVVHFSREGRVEGVEEQPG